MHTIDIPQVVIDACIARRGKLHAYDSVSPETTALVVIDMQNSWVLDGHSALEIPETRDIIPNINRLAAAMRAAGGTVAWTQSTFPQAWTHAAYAHFGAADWRQRIVDETAPGTFGFQLADAMDVGADDIVVTKTKPSAFIQGSSDLEARLRARGCDTLVITGTLTNACCESSARDAAALGFGNIFVADATATRSDAEHNATLTNLIQLVADVRLTDEVIDLLR